MTSSGLSNNQRLHLHQLSTVWIVKLDRLQFVQVVLDDADLDIVVDMLLGRVEQLGFLAMVSVALDILSSVDSEPDMYNNLLELPAVLLSLLPLMKEQLHLVEVLLVSLFLVISTYSR